MEAPKIPGLVVELHQDSLLAPQLAVANRSGQTLEIFDEDGRAFLRIGPQDTRADVAAEAFHRTRISGGATPPAGTLSRQPRWRTVSRTAEYGWFDSRIATGPIEIPRAISAMTHDMPFGEWEIPLQLGSKRMKLRGYFVYTPPSQGVIRSVLLSPTEPAPGIQVQLAPGAVPAVMLSNSSALPVTVLDSRGEPYLRISSKGVQARLDSPDWLRSRTDPQFEGTGWHAVSSARSYVWFEHRAQYTGPAISSGPTRRFGDWRVPLLVGDRVLELRGAYEWVATPQRPKPQR